MLTSKGAEFKSAITDKGKEFGAALTGRTTESKAVRSPKAIVSSRGCCWGEGSSNL